MRPWPFPAISRATTLGSRTNQLCEGMERGAPSLRFWSTMHDVDDRPSLRAPSAKVSHEALSALRARLSPTMARRASRSGSSWPPARPRSSRSEAAGGGGERRERLIVTAYCSAALVDLVKGKV